MYMNVIDSKEGKIVAACDADLIGKVLREGKIVLNLDLHRSFYVGRRVGKDELKKELADAASANLVGKNSVECALECKMAAAGSIITIGGVPHVQIYRL